jgi:hypothetical protein
VLGVFGGVKNLRSQLSKAYQFFVVTRNQHYIAIYNIQIFPGISVRQDSLANEKFTCGKEDLFLQHHRGLFDRSSANVSLAGSVCA